MHSRVSVGRHYSMLAADDGAPELLEGRRLCDLDPGRGVAEWARTCVLLAPRTRCNVCRACKERARAFHQAGRVRPDHADSQPTSEPCVPYAAAGVRLASALRWVMATMIAKRSAASRLICCCGLFSCSNMAIFS